MIESHELGLRVYADDSGTAWFDDETRRAQSADLSLDQFVDSKRVARADRISLLGLRGHARLICELHRRYGTSKEILVGTPSVCPTISDRVDPNTVFAQMIRVSELRPSMGGWRNLDEGLLAAYRLIVEVDSRPRNEPIDDRERRLLEALREHPAWPAISFLDSPGLFAVSATLAEIVDPRWYVDPSSPDRGSRLRSYMGLIDKNMFDLWHGRYRQGGHYHRAIIMLNAWSNHDRIPPRLPGLDSPGNFAWRRMLEERRDKPLWQPRGLLRATELFLSLVRHVWLDRTSPSHCLFVPEYFFRRDGEAVASVDSDGTVAEAFSDHYAQCCG